MLLFKICLDCVAKFKLAEVLCQQRRSSLYIRRCRGWTFCCLQELCVEQGSLGLNHLTCSEPYAGCDDGMDSSGHELASS
jgi:hypothetical protein